MKRSLLDPHVAVMLAITGAAKNAYARATGIPEPWDVIPRILVLKWPAGAPPFRRASNQNGWLVEWQYLDLDPRGGAVG